MIQTINDLIALFTSWGIPQDVYKLKGRFSKGLKRPYILVLPSDYAESKGVLPISFCWFLGAGSHNSNSFAKETLEKWLVAHNDLPF